MRHDLPHTDIPLTIYIVARYAFCILQNTPATTSQYPNGRNINVCIGTRDCKHVAAVLENLRGLGGGGEGEI